MAPRKRFFYRLALVILSPVVALLVLELLARLKYTPAKSQSSNIFEYHSKKVFTLRPNIKGIFADQNVSTNSFGYRDEDFPASKQPREFRILALGDSVTFGDGVLASETYPEQLEKRFDSEFQNHLFQIVNAGVPGNGPMQEYYDLIEALDLAPNAVVLQFTLNDVTEPFIYLKRLGGSGWSYHGVRDIPAIDFYLGQHSALYCLAKNRYLKYIYQENDSDTIKQMGKRQEIYQKEKLITQHSHGKIEAAWAEYFSWLNKIAHTCQSKDLPLVILICPFEFQLSLTKEKDYPQKKLIAFAKERNIPYINLISILRSKFETQGLSYSNDSQKQMFWYQYFHDHDHLSASGHKFVSELLFPELVRVLDLSP